MKFRAIPYSLFLAPIVLASGCGHWRAFKNKDSTVRMERSAFASSYWLDLLAHPNGGKLIWASTTPFRDTKDPEGLEAKNDRVRRRNRIAAELAAERSLPASDLFTAVANHPEYIGPDGVHLAKDGQLACAQLAVSAIADVVGDRP